ncbi:hypothetical protein JCM11641_000808 [Rhodosporidiobolus odoratus]
MTSATTTGNCWVCGKKTAQRCGGCVQPDFSLFLCSKDHQKLIWPVHKLVCGDRAWPFRWPLLTPKEAADAKANLAYKFPDNKVLTLSEILKELFKFDEDHHERVVDFLTQAQGSEQHPELPEERRLPYSVRSLEQIRLRSKAEFFAPTQIIRFCHVMGDFFESPTRDIPDQPRPRWSSHALHLLFVGTAIQRAKSLNKNPSETADFVLYEITASHRLEQYLTREVMPINEQAAKGYLGVIEKSSKTFKIPTEQLGPIGRQVLERLQQQKEERANASTEAGGS